MEKASIAIIGGGLSGVHAAFLLEQQGIRDYVLVEARDSLGGRIASVPAAPSGSVQPTAGAPEIDCVDLGPTWFWPGYQQQLGRLVQDLGLQSFEQHEDGDMVVERSPNEAPARLRGYVNSPASMRLVGGMQAIVEALRVQLEHGRIITGQAVRRLRCSGSAIHIESENDSGHARAWQAEHVLLAAPPRLVEQGIEFLPALPEPLARQWRGTPTWMAPHAKYVAVFDKPFWRDQGLSGEGRSARGPMGEIHDASMPGASAALFGFLGVPAGVRQRVPEDVLRSHCRAQLARMFGPAAATPRMDVIKDWAVDPYTATAADLQVSGQHAAAPAATAPSGAWAGRLTGIGSEWSHQFPGYVAGAVEASNAGVEALLRSRANALVTGDAAGAQV